MRIGLISDTHGMLRPEVFEHFRGVDRILHAGDVGDPGILVELEAVAPTAAVYGNVDRSDVRADAETLERLTLEGRAVVLTHGHLFGSPNAHNLRAAYPDADVIVYGHTHRPRVDRHGGALIVNPGSAGPGRFGLKPSVARLLLTASAADVELIEL